MCLGVPGRIVDLDGNLATVDFWGVRRQVRLDLVDEPVAPGDYVLNHVGFAIRRIPAQEVARTLALYEEIMTAAEGDPMRQDVRDELRAAAPASATQPPDGEESP